MSENYEMLQQHFDIVSENWDIKGDIHSEPVDVALEHSISDQSKRAQMDALHSNSTETK